MSFNRYSAIATTGVLGQYIGGNGENFDLADLRPQEPGGELTVQQKEVKHDCYSTLGQVINSNDPKLIKYDLLARRVLEEGVNPSKKVKLGFTGRLKEIRIGKISYRMFGKTYYGPNKGEEEDE